MNEAHELTQLLGRIGHGDDAALERLLPLVYSELRVIARGQRRRMDAGNTLNTTALVHEAFVKMAGGAKPQYNDRCHFFAVAATAMRQILVDRARRRATGKRGGDWQQIDFEDATLSAGDQAEFLLDLDDALHALERVEPRLSRVVECRFFVGMQNEEIASVLGVTEKTVRRDWIKARAWLHRELSSSPRDP